MRKRGSKDLYYILIAVLLVLLLGLLLLNFLQKPPVPIPEQRIGELLSPALQETYSAPLSLQNISFYRAGFTPSEMLRRYMLAFTNDNNYTDTYGHLILFQQGLNSVSLNSALKIDLALAESLATAAEEVRRAGEKNEENENDKEACSYFNSLLNPSLLVMDLTLWTGESEIYRTLQNNQNIGIQCEFYYPQLSHGLFSYDPTTARMVQRSVFCDLSEQKSKCFGVWNYFWQYALYPVNYGAGCSLTDWMQQGFICVNGVDIQNDQLKATYIKYDDNAIPLDMITVDVKEEFQNALGASGKTILDLIRQHCEQIKAKTSKYTLPGLTGSSLTGATVNTEMSDEELNQELQQEYKKAMLFASLFSEACLANPQQFAKDLTSSGGAGQFGLNDPKSCLLDGVKELGESGLRQEVQCLNRYFGPTGMEKLQQIDGLPDTQCLPSAAQSGSQCTDISCLLPGGKKDCGTDGTKCGREPTKQEEKNLKDAGAGKAGEKWRVVDTRKEMDEICKRDRGASAAACSVQVTKTAYILKDNVKPNPRDPTTAPSPNKDGKMYTLKALVKHEQNHIVKDDLTNKNEAENEADRTKEDERNDKNFVKPKEPTPDGLEPDECSAQSKKIEAMADCLDKVQLGKFVHKPRGLAPGSKGPTPDPAPEDIGTSTPACSEAAQPNEGAGYFGTLVGTADQCLIGDFCDFTMWAAVSTSGGVNKMCQFVQSEEGKKPCPELK